MKMTICRSVVTTANPGNRVYIEPVATRWYRVPHWFAIDALTDVGRFRAECQAGFLFDGRSGGAPADIFEPNLGTQDELKEWLKHDVFGHDIGLTFEETNENLRSGLIHNCGQSAARARMVWAAVSASRKWFGEPGPDDRSFPNLKLLTVRHYAK